MDDHDMSGASRSSYYDTGYSSVNKYSSQTHVPANSGNNLPKSKEDKFQPKLVKLRNGSATNQSRRNRTEFQVPSIIGSSDQAVELRELIALYAEDDSPVLVSGETGVGKELVAKHLHALSDRRNGGFTPLNAGAVPETLAAAELFGHAKGAFTGAVGEREGAIARSEGGILFLDEIGDMPASVQVHLLRVLEDGMVTKVGGKNATNVDFRLVTATNVDLREQVASGKFRADLFYRINVLVIDVPPLRKRGDDVVEIAEAMIANHKDERYRKMVLTPNAADRLRNHKFPGNIRELRNVISRALVHARNGKIMPDDLRFEATSGIHQAAASDVLNVDEGKNLISRFLMMKALCATDGNVTKAAALTGRSRGTLHNMMKDLEGEDFAKAFQSVCAEIKALTSGC
ncbi:sigma-54 dependent transcriptional regulator [Hyphococcus formosus]|uniref:sigma 54-interacting transcriptional regulator n=1 Tax=Hyphococcus formosus TaxID=3143534 RepID=UPI00398ACAB4